MITVADTVDRFSSHLPTSLVDPAGLAAVQEVGGGLPAELADCCGFEVRLGTDMARADFAVQVLTEQARRSLAAHAEQRGWEPLTAFAQAWTDGEHPLAGLVGSLWLEFDVVDPHRGSEVPAVFLTVASGHTSDLLPDLVHALGLVGGRPLEPATVQAVQSCRSLVPAGGELKQVGTLQSRNHTPVRLCVAGLSPATVTTYLGALGAHDQAVVTEAVLAGSLDESVTCAVNVDIVGGSVVRTSTEYAWPDNRQLAGAEEPRWGPVLSRLVERGLCTRAERVGLQAWPGVTVERLAHRPQPGPLFRGLSHLKLEVGRSGLPVAKVYIGYVPDQLSLLLDTPAIRRPAGASRT